MSEPTRYRVILELENKDRALLEQYLCAMPRTVGVLYYYGLTEVEHFSFQHEFAALADAEGRN